jgi:hypothetical protein
MRLRLRQGLARKRLGLRKSLTRKRLRIRKRLVRIPRRRLLTTATTTAGRTRLATGTRVKNPAVERAVDPTPPSVRRDRERRLRTGKALIGVRLIPGKTLIGVVNRPPRLNRRAREALVWVVDRPPRLRRLTGKPLIGIVDGPPRLDRATRLLTRKSGVDVVANTAATPDARRLTARRRTAAYAKTRDVRHPNEGGWNARRTTSGGVGHANQCNRYCSHYSLSLTKDRNPPVRVLQVV